MQKKLTIRIDEDIIARAKAYAATHDRTLSEMVESYFDSLTEDRKLDESELTPRVRKMVGILKGSGLDIDDYKQYLIDKYL